MAYLGGVFVDDGLFIDLRARNLHGRHNGVSFDVFEWSSATRMPQMREGVHVGDKNLTGAACGFSTQIMDCLPKHDAPGPGRCMENAQQNVLVQKTLLRGRKTYMSDLKSVLYEWWLKRCFNKMASV